MNSRGSIDFKRIIILAGAVIAFTIGSGFATGQEIMQYYASYGKGTLIVLAVFVVCFLYYNLNFSRVSAAGGLTRSNDIYKYFCGKHVGTFYDYYSTVFCYMSFWVMIGGAASTLNQQYGLPAWVGGVVLCALSIFTVVGGLEKVVDAIGLVGPVIVVLCIAIAVITLANDGSNIGAGLDALANKGAGLAGVSADNPLMQASANEWLSGFSYAGFVLLWFASFIASLGMTNRRKTLDFGIIVGTIFVALAIVLTSFALIANINTPSSDGSSYIWNAAIPNLILAERIWPPFAGIFALVVFAGIYTTAVPLLMNPVNRFAKEGTARYRILTIALGLVGLVVGLFVPFRVLVNVLYVINGYLGALLLIFMVVTNILEALGKKKNAVRADAASQETNVANAEAFLAEAERSVVETAETAEDAEAAEQTQERFTFTNENAEYQGLGSRFAASVNETQSHLALSIAYRQLTKLANEKVEDSMRGKEFALHSSDVKNWTVRESEDENGVAFALIGEMQVPVSVWVEVRDDGTPEVTGIVIDGIRMVGRNRPDTRDAIADAAAKSTKPAVVVSNQPDNQSDK